MTSDDKHTDPWLWHCTGWSLAAGALAALCWAIACGLTVEVPL